MTDQALIFETATRPNIVKRDAILSSRDGGRYRYRLMREWDNGRGSGICLFVMLNPSTADASEDDPTIRMCSLLAWLWGYDSLSVVNLFAYRATDPKQLYEVRNPVGQFNDFHIVQAVDEASLIVCAWGANKTDYGRTYDRATEFVRLASVLHYHDKLHCLAETKGGHPKHPLYSSRDAQPRKWRPKHGPLPASLA